jgi:hypothetical protein
MKIRNAIIITDADSALHMAIEEQPDFTGNVIFSREKLAGALVIELDRAVGRSTKKDAPASNPRRSAMKLERIG